MKNKKWMALVLVVCTLVCTPHLPENIFATSATQKREEAENNLKDVNNEISDIKDSQQEIADEISVTKKKLKSLLAQQQELEKEIDATNDAIEVTQQELAAATEEADKQYDAMVLRIQYMYENSAADSLWEALLKAEGLADLLNRVEYISQVHETDRELTQKYQDAVDTVIAKQDLLLEQMDELLAKEEVYLAQQADIEATLAQLNEDKAEFDSLLASAQKKATELKAEIAKQEAIIAEERRKAEEERKRKEEEEKKKQEAALLGSVTGTQIVNFALKYVGNPYVWGGNSLTKGCDCSGFVHLVYENFGISTPRYSMSFLNVGTEIEAKEENLQPGDIIVYNKYKGIGHVAIYIGNGKIVEAQSSSTGITSNRSWNCRSIAGVRRIVKNP